MKIYRDITADIRIKKPIVTVGSFDGVHKAHREIISLLNERAEACGGESVLITFSPHPRMVLNNDEDYRRNFRLLTTDSEKLELLEEAGLQNLIVLNFDINFSKIPFSNFIYDILVEKIGVYLMLVGYNNSFGKDRQGNYGHMLSDGEKYGFKVEHFDEQRLGDNKISSSRIRNFLNEGNVEAANLLLDYTYCMHGYLDKRIFIPSSKLKLIPAKGHYLTKVRLNTTVHYAICEIDTQMYFPDLHFSADGDKITVKFIKRVEI